MEKNIKRREEGITLVTLAISILILIIISAIIIQSDHSISDVANVVNESQELYEQEKGTVDSGIGNITNEWGNVINHKGIDGEKTVKTWLNSETIKDSSGNSINLANITNYYGHDVTYNGQAYQLFLVDMAGKYSNGEPRIWLQYKNYVGAVTPSDHYETTGISTANSILWQVNPDLDKKYGTTIRGLNNWNDNIKGTAYLCNPENWNSTYVHSSDIELGAFAIGGVSAEMFCDSYNQARGKVSTDADYFDAKAFNKNSTYGYWYKPTGTTTSGYYEGDYGSYTDNTNYPLPTSDYGGMYRPANNYTWLASTSANSTYRVCGVGGNNGHLSTSDANVTFGVRPAVSLPTSIQIQLTN